MIGAEPSFLKEYRSKNLSILKEKNLKKSQYFDVNKLDLLLKKPIKKTQIPLPEIKDQNIRVIPWSQALKEIPDKIKFILEKEENPKNQYEAFINANFNTGFIIITKRNSTLKDLTKYSIQQTKDQIIKNIIIIEENTQDLKILEHLKGDINYLNTTIYLEQNSKASFVRIFNLKENSFVNTQTLLQKDSYLTLSNAYLNGSNIHTRIINSLQKQGSSINQLDFSILDSNQFYNIDQISIHKDQNSQSHTVLKAVLKDSSSNVFDGMIKILPKGQKTNALLEAHSLLLSENASSNNIPSLEIEADDVKATHKATVTNLDENQIFYLTSRGISNQEAKNHIIKGFIENIILRLPKEYIEDLTKEISHKIKND